MSFKLCYYFNWVNFIGALVMKSELPGTSFHVPC